ncbi:MAG: hypothetical protein ACLR3U_02230 [Christensenellaceae bacterium]
MNKNARKLIPAVAMLLVSASMLSTASYAWFSMNSQVTAGGMNVNVAAPANLMISTDKLDWKTSIDAVLTPEGGKTLLGHASSVDGVSLFTVSPDEVDNVGNVKEDATIVAVDNTTFATTYGISDTVGYVDYTFYLATPGTEAMNVTLDSSATKFESTDTVADTTLINAMRFAVLTGETPAAPTENNVWCGATNNVTATQAYKTTSTKEEAKKFVSGKTLITLTAGSNGAYGEASKVTIRIWLEGSDSTAVNTNIAALKAYKLTVGFMVAETGTV